MGFAFFEIVVHEEISHSFDKRIVEIDLSVGFHARGDAFEVHDAAFGHFGTKVAGVVAAAPRKLSDGGGHDLFAVFFVVFPAFGRGLLIRFHDNFINEQRGGAVGKVMVLGEGGNDKSQ